jgi:hypothetical protein
MATPTLDSETQPHATNAPLAFTDAAPIIKTREQSRVFSSSYFKWGAASSVALVAAGSIYAATRSSDSDPQNKVVAAAPTQTTPVNSQKPSPTPTATENVKPSPTDIPTTPAVPEQITPTPLKDRELYGTIVSMPSYYFEGLINQDTLDEITFDRPEITKLIRPSNMSIEAIHQDITGKKIASYQKYLDNLYANPDTKAILATPSGLFDPQSLQYFDRDGLTNLISATSDTWLVNIANQTHANLPGASSDLMKAAFLNNELIRINKARVDAGVGSVETGTFFRATDTEPLSVYDYRTTDGAVVTLISTYNTYEDGQKALNYYVLVPFESTNADLSPGSFLAIPYYREP